MVAPDSSIFLSLNFFRGHGLVPRSLSVTKKKLLPEYQAPRSQIRLFQKIPFLVKVGAVPLNQMFALLQLGHKTN